jgi:hypothetical protein
MAISETPYLIGVGSDLEPPRGGETAPKKASRQMKLGHSRPEAQCS